MTLVTSRKLAVLISLKDHLRDIIEQTNARAIAQEDNLMRSLSDTLMALAELADVMEREAELHQQVYKAMLEPEFGLHGIIKGRWTSKEPNTKELRAVPASWIGDMVIDHEETIYREVTINDLTKVVEAGPATFIKATDRIEA